MPFLDNGLHLNQGLTDFGIGFTANLSEYLWNKLLPIKIVRHRSDYIRSIDKGNLLQLRDLRVGKGGRIADVSFKIGENFRFNAVDFAAEATLRSSESANADEVLQYEQEQLATMLTSMWSNLEVVVLKQVLRDPAKLTNNTDLSANPADQWDSYGSVSSDPCEDIKRRVLRIKSRTGRKPNLVVMHDMTWDVIQRHPSTLARGAINPSGNAVVTKAMFEAYCDLDPGALVTTSITYNTALEGQTPDFRSMIGPDVIIAHVEAGGLRNYGLGQTFAWAGGNEYGSLTERAGVTNAPLAVYQFPDNNRDPRGATVMRIVCGLDFQVTTPDAGELIVNAVDSTNTAAYSNFLAN